MSNTNQFDVVTSTGEEFNCTIKEIHQMVASGKLTRDCRIKRKGTEKWTVAAKVKGLEFPDDSETLTAETYSNKVIPDLDDMESTPSEELDPRLKSWLNMTAETVVGEMNRSEDKT